MIEGEVIQFPNCSIGLSIGSVGLKTQVPGVSATVSNLVNATGGINSRGFVKTDVK